MADNEQKPTTFLHTNKEPVWWDWWSENPIEIILVIFILVLFFALPRAGCGVTNVQPTSPGTPAVHTQAHP